MGYKTIAHTASIKIQNEVNSRKRESKAKTELITLLDSFNRYQRERDQEEANRVWLESVDEVFYSGTPANRRFLRKVCFPYDRDVESPLS